MKITNNGIPGAALTPKPPAVGATASSTNAASVPAGGDDGYTPSPELTRLLDMVREQPEVRENRVQEAAAKLASGYYSTPQSIAATADAILADV